MFFVVRRQESRCSEVALAERSVAHEYKLNCRLTMAANKASCEKGKIFPLTHFFVFVSFKVYSLTAFCLLMSESIRRARWKENNNKAGSENRMTFRHEIVKVAFYPRFKALYDYEPWLCIFVFKQHYHLYMSSLNIEARKTKKADGEKAGMKRKRNLFGCLFIRTIDSVDAFLFFLLMVIYFFYWRTYIICCSCSLAIDYS